MRCAALNMIGTFLHHRQILRHQKGGTMGSTRMESSGIRNRPGAGYD
jgi:hypothetical protein